MEGQKIQEVVGDIYEASYKPEHWNIVLSKIGEITNSDSAALLYSDTELERAGGTYIWNLSQETQVDYSQLEIDPNFVLFSEKLPIGTASTADLLIPDRKELEAFYGEKYNLFAEKYDLYYIAGVILFNDNDRMVGIGLQRSKSKGPWLTEEIDQLSELSPHIQRALNIHKEFMRLKTREIALNAGLDRMVMGIILISETFECIYCNSTAEKIIKDANVLELNNGQLKAISKSDDRRLQDALSQIIQSKAQVDDDNHFSFGLWRKDRPTQYPVLVTQTQYMWHELSLEKFVGQAVIFITDPERNQPIIPEALITTYELTPAEAKVAIAIANGYSLEEISQLHNTKLTTTRTHLHSIFKKMNISRQSELVKMLLTGPFRVSL